MNYEEFIEEYSGDLDKIEVIYFSTKEGMSGYTSLSDDPKKYVDIASKCNRLKHIVLEETKSQEYYKAVVEFLKNSNDEIKISTDARNGNAGKEDFFKSEELIDGIIEQINPEWNDKQKAAFVHYKMGEMISYMPDFQFNEVGNQKSRDVRNIWTAINNRTGVCNGVVAIERNILSRVGLKTRELSSKTHSFILVETEEGNIITDPTWDLTNTLFEARPMYFGKTYEQLRQIDGPFSKAHKLDEPPENVTEISVEELREIYKSIGIAKENGNFKFPILDGVNEINNQQFDSNSEKVSVFLQMFTKDFSSQATHLAETRTMIERCMPSLGIDSKSFTTGFVYSKDDETSEKPYLCMHIDNEEMKDNMVILNTAKMKFENMSIKDFDGLYKVHNEDTREVFWKKYLQREEITRETEQDKSEK